MQELRLLSHFFPPKTALSTGRKRSEVGSGPRLFRPSIADSATSMLLIVKQVRFLSLLSEILMDNINIFLSLYVKTEANTSFICTGIVKHFGQAKFLAPSLSIF